MNEVKLNMFPSNEYEALAMLYVQSRDLSNASPCDLWDMYKDAYNKITGYVANKLYENEDWL